MARRIKDSPSAYLRRASAWLVGGFAALALLSGGWSLWRGRLLSKPAHSEIGVRMALRRPACHSLPAHPDGGRAAHCRRLVIGLACSIAAANLIRGLLFGVDPWDWRALLLVAVVLGVSGPLASYLPARRAASINPVDALRAE